VAKFGNWFFVASACALIIGCGGGGADTTGGGNGSGGSSGGSGSRSYPSFSLGQNGLVQVTVLSGKDRRGVGSQIAVLAPMSFENGLDRIPSTDVPALEPLAVVLDEYLVNTREIGVQFDGNTPTKEFTEFPFEVTKLQEITDTEGGARDLPGTAPVITVPAPFDVDMRVFPGRHTSLQFQLDQEMINYTDTTGIVFDEDKFTLRNYDTRVNAIRGTFSDYVAFDISGMAAADRPLLSTGARADRIYFSGDAIAVSSGINPSGAFEMLDPVAVKGGTVRKGTQIGDRVTENTYSLEDRDPANTRVAAMTGIWKDYKTVVTSSGDVTMIAIPGNADGTTQQLIVYRESGGRITGMWEGRAQYGVAGDTSRGTFKLFPISTVTSAIPDTANQTDGNLSNLIYTNEKVMRGDWDVTKTGASWSFGTSGGFAVFRR